MKKRKNQKAVLNGYIGVKFKAVCLDKRLPQQCETYISYFKENGKRLLEYNMAPANGGNMSMGYKQGFLITASGCNLGCTEDDEIIFVEDFSIENKLVQYRGSCPPSSETFLHGLLYQKKQDIGAIIHAHDETATSMNLSGIIHETEREEPYGTVELANLCMETFGQGNDNIIVLKNHGYVAAGSSLNQVTDIIINMHNHLGELRGKQK